MCRRGRVGERGLYKLNGEFDSTGGGVYLRRQQVAAQRVGLGETGETEAARTLKGAFALVIGDTGAVRHLNHTRGGGHWLCRQGRQGERAPRRRLDDRVVEQARDEEAHRGGGQRRASEQIQGVDMFALSNRRARGNGHEELGHRGFLRCRQAPDCSVWRYGPSRSGRNGVCYNARRLPPVYGLRVQWCSET